MAYDNHFLLFSEKQNIKTDSVFDDSIKIDAGLLKPSVIQENFIDTYKTTNQYVIDDLYPADLDGNNSAIEHVKYVLRLIEFTYLKLNENLEFFIIKPPSFSNQKIENLNISFIELTKSIKCQVIENNMTKWEMINKNKLMQDYYKVLFAPLEYRLNFSYIPALKKVDLLKNDHDSQIIRINANKTRLHDTELKKKNSVFNTSQSLKEAIIFMIKDYGNLNIHMIEFKRGSFDNTKNIFIVEYNIEYEKLKSKEEKKENVLNVKEVLAIQQGEEELTVDKKALGLKEENAENVFNEENFPLTNDLTLSEDVFYYLNNFRTLEELDKKRKLYKNELNLFKDINTIKNICVICRQNDDEFYINDIIPEFISFFFIFGKPKIIYLVTSNGNDMPILDRFLYYLKQYSGCEIIHLTQATNPNDETVFSNNQQYKHISRIVFGRLISFKKRYPENLPLKHIYTQIILNNGKDQLMETNNLFDSLIFSINVNLFLLARYSSGSIEYIKSEIIYIKNNPFGIRNIVYQYNPNKNKQFTQTPANKNNKKPPSYTSLLSPINRVGDDNTSILDGDTDENNSVLYIPTVSGLITINDTSYEIILKNVFIYYNTKSDFQSDSHNLTKAIEVF